MTEETKLACSVNHNYREGYKQGKEDATEELHEILQDIVTAQSMINRSVFRLNRILYEVNVDGK